MKIGDIMTVLIPAAVLGYALWLVIRMIRDRKSGKCSLGGCAGCPFREGCETAEQLAEAEKQGKEGEAHE